MAPNTKQHTHSGDTKSCECGCEYIMMEKSLADTLIHETIGHDIRIQQHMDEFNPNIFENILGKANTITANEYTDILISMADGYIKTAIDTLPSIDDAYHYRDIREAFLYDMEPRLNEILTNTTTNAFELKNEIYYNAKEMGYAKNEAELFFGVNDVFVLSYLKQYDFALIKNLSNDLKTGISQKVMESNINGWSMPRLAKEIKSLGIEPLKTGNRVWTVEQRAITIARTESARAQMTANVMDAMQNGVTEFNWSDSGNEEECDDCAELAAGNPYYMGELPEYPAHPNCVCDIVPAPMTETTAILDPMDNSGYCYDPIGGGLLDIPEGFSDMIDLPIGEGGGVEIGGASDLSGGLNEDFWGLDDKAIGEDLGGGPPGSIHTIESRFQMGTEDAFTNRMEHVYTFPKDNLEITIMKDIDTAKQTLTPENVFELYKNMPTYLQDAVDTIKLTDERSIFDMVNTEKYGHEFRAFASMSDKNMVFYANPEMGEVHNLRYAADTIVHEAAHSVDEKVMNVLLGLQDDEEAFYAVMQDSRYSELNLADKPSLAGFDGKEATSWADVVKADDEFNTYARFPTPYAKDSYDVMGNYTEDFAESYMKYLNNAPGFKETFPNRYDKLTEIDEFLNKLHP